MLPLLLLALVGMLLLTLVALVGVLPLAGVATILPPLLLLLLFPLLFSIPFVLPLLPLLLPLPLLFPLLLLARRSTVFAAGPSSPRDAAALGTSLYSGLPSASASSPCLSRTLSLGGPSGGRRIFTACFQTLGSNRG